jgi:hypothetical protein
MARSSLTLLALVVGAIVSTTGPVTAAFPETGTFLIKSANHINQCVIGKETETETESSSMVGLVTCSRSDTQQQWLWNPKTHELKNVATGWCVGIAGTAETSRHPVITADACESGKEPAGVVEDDETRTIVDDKSQVCWTIHPNDELVFVEDCTTAGSGDSGVSNAWEIREL